MTRRVVITGMGWVTPLGCDVDAAWQRLLRGENAVGPVTRFDASTFATNFAAEVRDFRLADHLAGRVEGWERFQSAGIGTQFALASGAVAVRQAGLPGTVNLERVGIYMGAGEGPTDVENLAAANIRAWDAATRTLKDREWTAEALRLLRVQTEAEQEPNAAIAHMADAFGCRGPSANCMTACAAGTQAIGEASEIIRRGDADVMLAGGAHSMIHPLGMTGFIRLTAMSSRRDSPDTAARPFDQTRDGFVMGEGAGVLVLESAEHALARGATPLCELAGYGSSADAFRITDIQEDGRGAVAAMTLACRQAGIDPGRAAADGRPPVHYISAHGTGTKENDKIETRAVKALFGDLARKVPFSSVKSMFGHLIQAAGAVELMTCVQAIRTGWLPPTMNLHTPDPECDLDYIPNSARDCRGTGVDVCLSNSFGFGGQNDSALVKRFVG